MTQNNAEAKELAVVYDIDGNEIKLTYSIVQQYIVGSDSKISMAEFKFFTELCKVQKLNPFMKEPYCIKYSDKVPAQIVVGKDVFLKRAVKHPMYDGKESGIIVMTNDNEIQERIGCFFAPGEKVIGGWARVYRKDRVHPEYMSVSVEEVSGKKQGAMNSSWSEKTATMVEKVAKVRALRESFIEELQGMYEADEFVAPTYAPQNIVESAIEAEAEVVEQVSLGEI